jgi:hypothetical protein
MIRRVAARHPLQHRLVAEPAEPATERRPADRRGERLRIRRDGGAQLLQGGLGRHPDSAGREALARLEVEIVSRAPAVIAPSHAPAGVAMRQPHARVGLVRRLVLRKPDVAVDPEHRTPRVADDLRRHPCEPDVELIDERLERLAHLALVLGAVRLEPLPPVVLLEAAEKRERSRPYRAESVHVG